MSQMPEIRGARGPCPGRPPIVNVAIGTPESVHFATSMLPQSDPGPGGLGYREPVRAMRLGGSGWDRRRPGQTPIPSALVVAVDDGEGLVQDGQALRGLCLR